MPFYQFSLRIDANDDMGQRIANKLHQGVRQLPNPDIDNVWREYKRKAQIHYGSKLRSFEVIQISKLDPRAIKFVESQNKRKIDSWDSVFQNISDNPVC